MQPGLSRPRPYDAAICLCEGHSDCWVRDDDPAQHDRAILQNIYDVIKPGTPFMLKTFTGIASCASSLKTMLKQIFSIRSRWLKLRPGMGFARGQEAGACERALLCAI